jgi:hypothetical protein
MRCLNCEAKVLPCQNGLFPAPDPGGTLGLHMQLSHQEYPTHSHEKDRGGQGALMEMACKRTPSRARRNPGGDDGYAFPMDRRRSP